MAYSVTNSYQSFVSSSILKRPGLLLSGNTNNRVRFKLPSDLQSIFCNLIMKGDVKPYDDLVSTVGESVIQDDDLYIFLCDVRRNVQMMDKTLHKFVHALLKLKWAHRNHRSTMQYKTFLIDLLSTHNYYTKRVFEELVSTFKSEDCSETKNGVPTEKADRCCENIHNVLGVLLRIIPMASHLLSETLRARYPYLRRDAKEHESFVTNVLKISQYYPDLRRELFCLIIERLVMLDVNASRTEIAEVETECEMEATECEVFQMEESSVLNMKHPIANTLDITLHCVFRYMHASCHDVIGTANELNWDNKTYQFYQELMTMFDEVILPTDATHHIQFLLFYLCSFDVTILEEFLHYLWEKALSDDEELVIKQKAVAYIASLLARAVFVSVSTARTTLAKMAEWIHAYIDRREGLDFILSELRMHPMFYSVCQALFYVVAFRHQDLLNPLKNLEFFQKLNLVKMVSSQLNPLRVCIPEIVQNFAYVASIYQLAYCDPVIEYNSRNVLPVIHRSERGTTNTKAEKEILDSFFPFDPFVLIRSRQIISPLYREYQGPMEESEQPIRKIEEDDDFMGEPLSASTPKPSPPLSEKQDISNVTTCNSNSTQNVSVNELFTTLPSLSNMPPPASSSSPGFKHM